MKKRFLLILCISSLTLLSGCNPSKNSEDDNKGTTTNNYDYISLNKTTLNLKSNETFTLEVYDSNNKLINSDNLNFTSSNKDLGAPHNGHFQSSGKSSNFIFSTASS